MAEPSAPVAVWSGELSLAGITMRVHMLDDGTRIIEADDFEAFWRAVEGGAQPEPAEVEAFARWQRGGELT